MKHYLAEALGTFALTLAVGLSLTGNFPVPTAVLAAITLGLFVYSIGHISGAHLNPAVTIGAWSIKKIKTEDAIAYLISQFCGAALALVLISSTLGSATLVVSDSQMTGLAELIGTFFFTFGVASVIYARVSSKLSGVVVGGSLLLGIAIAVLLGSNGVLNPAVALGIKSFSPMYIFGPIIGSILGMQAYKYLHE